MFKELTLVNKIKIILATLWTCLGLAISPLWFGLAYMCIADTKNVDATENNIYIWLAAGLIIVWLILVLPFMVWLVKKMTKFKVNKFIPICLFIISVIIGGLFVFL